MGCLISSWVGWRASALPGYMQPGYEPLYTQRLNAEACRRHRIAPGLVLSSPPDQYCHIFIYASPDPAKSTEGQDLPTTESCLDQGEGRWLALRNLTHPLGLQQSSLLRQRP